MASPVRDWELERLALGELSKEKEAELRARLRAAESDAQRLEELERSNAAILSDHPPALVAEEVARRLERERRRAAPATSRSWWLAAPALAAAALALLVVVPRGADPRAPSAEVEDTVRLKGARPRLLAYRLRAGVAEPLADASEARSGEVVQLAYVASGHRYGVILSIDGNGAVTLHLPERGDTSAELAQGRETGLEHSYELDAAPRFERFIFVSSDLPFPTAPLIDAARALAANPSSELAVPRGAEQSSLLLRKVTP